jgi:hypothetical protein
MLREGEPVPEIYNDLAFSKTNHWELSTSQLSSKFVDGWGYGEGSSCDIARFDVHALTTTLPSSCA